VKLWCVIPPGGGNRLVAHREAFQRLMNEGVGFVAVHWATGVGYSKLADDETFRETYKNILGGWFRRPPGDVYIGTGRLVQVDRQHPICRGWDGHDVQDELPGLVFTPMPVWPSSQCAGQGSRGGVVFQRPDSHGGRSFGTVLGHYHDNFVQEGFRRALVNGILWSAHLDIPEGGANVTVDPQALQLPPPPTAETATP
jgi:type 1 glutamine amidotransferase